VDGQMLIPVVVEEEICQISAEIRAAVAFLDTDPRRYKDLAAALDRLRIFQRKLVHSLAAYVEATKDRP